MASTCSSSARAAARLREQWPALFTFGCCGGNVGYLPTSDAYASPDDHACYTAPKLYDLFPFAPQIEDILLAESSRALSQT